MRKHDEGVQESLPESSQEKYEIITKMEIADKLEKIQYVKEGIVCKTTRVVPAC